MEENIKEKKLRIVMSGGSGLLGSALQLIDSDIIAPSHEEMDVTDIVSIRSALEKYKPDIFIHAAAYTSPPRCDENPMTALTANIIGTANAVLIAKEQECKLVYISTDYVFRGDKGNYVEDDAVFPQNRYAWSKLGGECAVRMYDKGLIIRTSFYPDEFPYQAAFVDQYTSRDGVSVIAKLIYEVISRDTTEPVVHIGTERKTVKELALKLGKLDVKDLRRSDVSFVTPEDTSLDVGLFKKIIS